MDKILIGIMLIVVLILLETLLEQIYMKSHRYKLSLGGAYNLKNVPSNIEICNIGSGPALYGITYAECTMNGFNFGTSPQSYKYGFKILNNFKDNILDNAMVIITICPLSFGNNLACEEIGYSDKFYGILQPEDIDGYTRRRKLLNQHPILLRIFEKCKNKCEKNKVKNTTKNEPRLISRWKNQFLLENLVDPTQSINHEKAFEDKVKVIQEGIELCNNNHWRPIFVIPPISPLTKQYISQEFLEKFLYDNLLNIQKKYPKVLLLDYYNDARFDTVLFKGDICMNDIGKRKFSEILFSDIKLQYEESREYE